MSVQEFLQLSSKDHFTVVCPASLAFIGQVTEKKTVKWPINNTPRKNTGGGLPY